jgi:hypothetical protein
LFFLFWPLSVFLPFMDSHYPFTDSHYPFTDSHYPFTDYHYPFMDSHYPLKIVVIIRTRSSLQVERERSIASFQFSYELFV